MLTLEPYTIARPQLRELGRFARDDIRAVFARFGIDEVFRSLNTSDDEEYFFINSIDYQNCNVEMLVQGLQGVVPHAKIGVFIINEHWSVEPL